MTGTAAPADTSPPFVGGAGVVANTEATGMIEADVCSSADVTEYTPLCGQVQSGMGKFHMRTPQPRSQGQSKRRHLSRKPHCFTRRRRPRPRKKSEEGRRARELTGGRSVLPVSKPRASVLKEGETMAPAPGGPAGVDDQPRVRALLWRLTPSWLLSVIVYGNALHRGGLNRFECRRTSAIPCCVKHRSGPNLVRRSGLPEGWEHYLVPEAELRRLGDANGRRWALQGVVLFRVRLDNSVYRLPSKWQTGSPSTS